MKKSKNKTLKRILLVLLCMVFLTVLLASLAVPASAVDPFLGSEAFDFEYLLLFRIPSDSSMHIELLNPLPAYFTFNSGEILSIIDDTLTLDFNGNNPSFEFIFDSSDIFANDFVNFPFESCNRDVFASVGGTNILIPAGTNIVDYLQSQDISAGISVIFKPLLASGSSGPYLYEFVLNPSGVSRQYVGGFSSVFDHIGTLLFNTFNILGGVFFDNGSLTVLGGLAIGSLGVSVILLLIKVISNFIRFRG